jgi:large subunit ribosomal protein L4
LDGNDAGTVQLDPSVFAVEWTPALIHQVVRVQNANQRSPIAHTKTRAEVRGGGKKPWKQKGTGRARHGSTRSPIWVGGGVTFGPRNTRNYTLKINRKVKRKALCMALSAKLSEQAIVVVANLDLQPMKTKTLSQLMKATNLVKGGLIIPAAHSPELRRVTRNLTGVSLLRADSLNVVDVLKAKKLLIAKDAFPVIEKIYQVSRPRIAAAKK